MAWQHLVFSRQLHLPLKWLKALLISFIVALLVVIFHPSLAAATNASQQAQALLEQGKQQLAQGSPATALKSWKRAAALYRNLGDSQGVTGSLINQSAALQAMGEYRRACTTLTEALELGEEICPSPLRSSLPLERVKDLIERTLAQQPPTSLQVLGLRNLGEVYRQLSQPENSAMVLQEGLEIAATLDPQPDTNALRLNLGNTYKTFASRARGQYSNLDALGGEQEQTIQRIEEVSKKALDLYQQAAASPNLATSLSAQLNRLSLLTDLHQWIASQTSNSVLALQALDQVIQPQIWPLVEQLQTANFSRLPPLEKASSSISFADSLFRISQDQAFDQAEPLAIEYAQSALQTGKALGNRRIQSAAAGVLGQAYKAQGSPAQARQQFAAALGWAESAEAWDLAYQWQAEMGHLLQEVRNLPGAIGYYRKAVASLEQVRGGLLAFDPEYQFSFKEKVEPIYQQYMQLLFDAPNPSYAEILRVNEQLRLAELENYLQCGRLNLISATELRGPRPTFIYVLNLGNRFEELVLSTDGTIHRHTPDSTVLADNAALFLTHLSDPNLKNILEAAYWPFSQALYEQLITPIKSFLPPSGTLVFSLDTALQGIPMELLHNGQSYLLEDYSIALTLGSQIRPPQSLAPRNLKVLLAGLSQESPSFQSPQVPPGLQPLPAVQVEISQIQQVATRDKELLNQAFTHQRFQTLLESGSFPVVHVATHGQFSSDPDQTLLLAWDQPITVSQFNALLNSRPGSQLDLELLTLSACETAQGDKRSALGLAGVAVQSGARSTLASLWLVDEASTAELMAKFYKNLKDGMTKAEAKRQAQLSLMHNPQTSNPYLWAAFVLVGSWM
jgi:CHAT domain-containing protein